VIVLASSLALIGASYVAAPSRLAPRTEELLLAALALLWLGAAIVHREPGRFLPFGASVLATLAAAVAMRAMGHHLRRMVVQAVIAALSLVAVFGLIASDERWYPWATQGEGLWHLAGTITYANAMGLALAMTMIIACRWVPRTTMSSLAVALCAAGVLASQSRGAIIAAVVGCLVVRRQVAAHLSAILIGVLAGSITVAASPSDARRPAVLLIVVPLIAIAPFVQRAVHHRPGDRSPAPVRSAWVVLGSAAVCGAFVATFIGRSTFTRRLDVGSDLARIHEWRIALSEFGSSPLTGVGPDRLRAAAHHAHKATFLAHNEYVQVLAGAGVLALVLVGFILVRVTSRIRETPRGSSTAAAALVAFAIGGVFDYAWHIPVVGILAGVCLGLATNSIGPAAHIVTHSPSADEAGAAT
jgi:hypothetical protein